MYRSKVTHFLGLRTIGMIRMNPFVILRRLSGYPCDFPSVYCICSYQSSTLHQVPLNLLALHKTCLIQMALYVTKIMESIKLEPERDQERTNIEHQSQLLQDDKEKSKNSVKEQQAFKTMKKQKLHKIK